jgi:hypothetical protein
MILSPYCQKKKDDPISLSLKVHYSILEVLVYEDAYTVRSAIVPVDPEYHSLKLVLSTSLVF